MTSIAIEVGIDRATWLPHLSEQPKIGHDRILEAEPFFVDGLGAKMAPLSCDRQFRIQLQVVLTSRIGPLCVLLLFFEQAHHVR